MGSNTRGSVRALWNRQGYICVFWMVLQQLIVATSTYLLIEAMSFATSGEIDVALTYLLWFGLSLVIVYIPNALSELYRDRWKIRSFDLFLGMFADQNRSKTTLFHAKAKAEHESWVTHEGASTYDECTSCLIHLLGTVLNSVLNIIVIGLMMDASMLIWYGLATVVMLVANHYAKPTIKERSLGVQNARRALSTVVLSVWDNVTAGNAINREVWSKDKARTLAELVKRLDRYNVTRAIVSSGAVSVAFAIVCLGVAQYLYANMNDLSRVSAMIVTIPRQVQIIQSIFMFFGLYLAWVGSFERLKQLGNVLQVPSLKEQAADKVDLKSIVLDSGGSKTPIASADSLVQQITRLKSGRLTLRGKNGAGKSALLAILAESISDRRIFVPASPKNLRFGVADESALSDGQRMLAIINRIKNIADVDFLILDEWDANLDQHNRALISKEIDHIAATKVVVEVRH